MDNPKFCRNCKHFVRFQGTMIGLYLEANTEDSYSLGKCSRFGKQSLNLVSGFESISRPFAEHERKPEGQCGPDAKFFEALP